MIDTETTIRDLETIGAWHTHHYTPFHYECAETIHNVLELLRIHEPAKPEERRREVKINHAWGNEVEIWSEFYCPHCKAMIAKGKSEHYQRCMWCGKVIKWE